MINLSIVPGAKLPLSFIDVNKIRKRLKIRVWLYPRVFSILFYHLSKVPRFIETGESFPEIILDSFQIVDSRLVLFLHCLCFSLFFFCFCWNRR